MGAGKSSVGRRLAARLGFPFSDLDDEVEAAAGRSIADLFEDAGEDAFRTLESRCLRERLGCRGRVVATGGGAVLDEGNRELLAERACVVWLGAQVDTQLARVAGDDARPLLRDGDPEAVLRMLAANRTPLYRKVADLRLETDELSEDQVVAILEEMVRYRWKEAGGRRGAHVIEVRGAHPYLIHIGPGLLEDSNALAAQVRGRHALVVSDANVGPLYSERTIAALTASGRLQARLSTVAAGEQSKSLDEFGELLRDLAELGATRDACVFALGGGVVGDLAGFAAACWMRGIDLVQLPTSLLAMVDSSVGGKTAIDVPQGKNLVGAFYPPRAVFADTRVLATLPERELRAGLAEVVKYGAITDARFLDWLAANAQRLLARDADVLAEAIARSCAHKVAIVERDPHERGERALLNFGHTFAHAIEAEQGFGRRGQALTHGEAVAVGMVLAARLSAARGMAGEEDALRLAALLDAFGLPTRLPAGLDPRALLTRMRLDKKAGANGLRFILWTGAGKARVVSGVPEDHVLKVLSA
jgi:3-dehydroquinate synthase